MINQSIQLQGPGHQRSVRSDHSNEHEQQEGCPPSPPDSLQSSLNIINQAPSLMTSAAERNKHAICESLSASLIMLENVEARELYRTFSGSTNPRKIIRYGRSIVCVTGQLTPYLVQMANSLNKIITSIHDLYFLLSGNQTSKCQG